MKFSVINQSIKSLGPARLLWRLLLAISVLCILASITYRYVGASGEFVVEYEFDEKPGPISEILPKGRALDRESNLENGSTFQRLIGEPTYFSVDLPSAYPKVTVEMEYQNPNHALVELGIQYAEVNEEPLFRIDTIENKFVEDSTWDRIEEDNLTLLQRDPTYTSIADFKSNPPSDAKIGTWRAGLELPLTYPEGTYQDAPGGASISTPLVGAHEFYTYVGSGENDSNLEFDITYVDTNLTDGEDEVEVEIGYLSKQFEQYIVPDDGIILGTGEVAEENTITIDLPIATEGVYAVKLKTSDDIITTGVTTEQDKLVIKRSVKLAGAEQYADVLPYLPTTPTQLYTESDILSVLAPHSSGVSTLQVNDDPLHIHTTDKLYTWNTPVSRQYSTVVVPNNAVHIQSDHYFTMDEASWFDPAFGIRELTSATSVDQLDMIISRQYTTPDQDRNWIITSTDFDLTTVTADDPSQLYFIISAPGLDQSPRPIKVRTIRIIAEKEPITLRNIWDRISAKLK